MPESPTILLVDDEDSIQKLLTYPLERDGYRVVPARDGEEALRRFAEEEIDLVVLDIMLPKLDGLEVCKRLRAESTVPIIMLTARDDELDKVLGLELGADDYITKPFSPRELIARVRAVLRRLRPALAGGALDYAGISMDTAAHRVTRDGANVQLGPTEFRLLRHFLERPKRVHSRDQLLDAVWGMDKSVDLRTVDVHIRRLRVAINLGGKPDLIRTVRSAGYALDAAEQDATAN